MIAIIKNEDEMRQVVLAFMSDIKGGDLILLNGELGAGKTTFTKCLVKELGADMDVTSPTYNIAQEYEVDGEGFEKIIHVDLYRLEGKVHEDPIVKEVLENRQKNDRITVIEWANKLAGVKGEWNILFEHGDIADARIVRINENE